MKSSLLFVSLFFGVLAANLLLPAGIQAADVKTYKLATASLGGTYHPVGEAIAILSSVKLLPVANIRLEAVTSAGSGENIKSLRENTAQFAILQGLFGYFAWNGKGPFAQDGPQKNLRSVSMLWQNVEHFTILKDKAKTKTMSDIADLKGSKLSLGKKNSGTIVSNLIILNNLGIDAEKDYQLTSMGYSQSADALKQGDIVGMGTPAGVPASVVNSAFLSMGDKLTLLSFTDEQVKKADGGYGLWLPFVIPADTYPGVKQNITTVAQPNFLAVGADMDEQTVYLMTKLIYENLRFLQNIHPATKEISKEKAMAGLPIPLHPGAIKYYREIGLTVPENLIAK